MKEGKINRNSRNMWNTLTDLFSRGTSLQHKSPLTSISSRMEHCGTPRKYFSFSDKSLVTNWPRTSPAFLLRESFLRSYRWRITSFLWRKACAQDEKVIKLHFLTSQKELEHHAPSEWSPELCHDRCPCFCGSTRRRSDTGWAGGRRWTRPEVSSWCRR